VNNADAAVSWLSRLGKVYAIARSLSGAAARQLAPDAGVPGRYEPREQIGPIERAVGETAASAHPFTLRLSGAAGVFTGGSGGVLWVGLEDAPMLEELAAGLRRASGPWLRPWTPSRSRPT
jgi:hypothetical protein